MKLRRANPSSGAPMGLRNAYPRGGERKRSDIRSVECIIERLVGIVELPSQPEEHGYVVLECGMGEWSTEKRNCLRDEIEEVQYRIRGSDKN
jgi:hypothetical protein